MRNTEQKKTWERTGTKGLLRHRNGTYYARLSIAGKMKFISLETKLKAVADIRFSEHRTRVLKGRKAARRTTGGTGTMGDLIAIYTERVKNDVDLKQGTRDRYLQDVKYCVKTWPEIEELRPDEITVDAIRDWKNRSMTHGTGFRPPGAKKSTPTKGRSGRTFNGGLSVLRRVLDIAVSHGAIHENVVTSTAKHGAKTLRAKDTPKPAYAPPPETLNAILEEIERGSGIAGWGVEVADFCRGLAFSGARQNEGAEIIWKDVDFAAGILRVRGTKTQSSDRAIPMNAALRALLEKIRRRRKENATIATNGEPFVSTDERVFRVGEAQNSLNRVCKILKTRRITHHNFRDYFCTRALMSGVPIRVLAEWLGHADKGGTLLKRYSHVIAEDSAAQAAKLNF